MIFLKNGLSTPMISHGYLLSLGIFNRYNHSNSSFKRRNRVVVQQNSEKYAHYKNWILETIKKILIVCLKARSLAWYSLDTYDCREHITVYRSKVFVVINIIWTQIYVEVESADMRTADSTAVSELKNAKQTHKNMKIKKSLHVCISYFCGKRKHLRIRRKVRIQKCLSYLLFLLTR